MVKKPRPLKADAPPPLNNKDHLERANFALQASLLLRQLGANRAPAAEGSETRDTATQPPDVAESSHSAAHPTASDSATQNPPSGAAVRQRKRRSKSGKEALGELSRTEVTSLRKWTVHNQVKLDPTVKRSLCSCGTVLVPGLTSRVRVKPSKQHKHRLVTSCLQCGSSSSVPMAKSSWSNRERPAPGATSPEDEQAKQERTAPDDAKIAGHVIWAGGERVVGWGEVSQP